MNDLRAIEMALQCIHRTLDAGHDAIIRAGGECDPVDMMYAADPTVRELQAHLASRVEPLDVLRKLKQFADEASPNLPKMFGIDFMNLNDGLCAANLILKD